MENFKIAKFLFYKLKKIEKFVNFDDSENFQFRECQIWGIQKISNLGNSKIFILENSKKFLNIIFEYSKFYNLENYKNSINFQIHEYKSSYILSVRII